MLRQSIKQCKDGTLIKKTIDSIQPKRISRHKLTSLNQQYINSSTDIYAKSTQPIQSGRNQARLSEKKVKNHELSIRISQESNNSDIPPIGYHNKHKQMQLLSLSQQSHPPTSQPKKKNAVYMRRSQDKAKIATLSPIKSQQLSEKSLINKKKVFYLSIKRSPFEKYNSKSQNLYHMPNFSQRQQQAVSNPTSCAVRYLKQCLSKSVNKPLRLNISMPSNQFDTIKGKSSALSAFPQPTPIKFKHVKSKEENVFQKIHDYIMTKRMKEEIQKSLIVECKKQEIVKNNSQRHNKQSQLRRKNIFRSALEKKSLSQSREQLQNCRENVKAPLNARIIINNAVFLSPKSSKSEKSHRKSFQEFLNKKQKLTIYEQKMMTYRQLIFLVNLAHRVFDPLVLADPLLLQKSEKTVLPKYRFYVGSGNNSKLIKALMKRRPWWQECSDAKQAHFVWTQIKQANVFSAQKTAQAYQNTQDNDQTQKQQFQCVQNNKLLIKQLNESQSNSKEYVFKPPFSLRGCSKILTPSQTVLYNTFLNSSSHNEFDNFQARLKYFPGSYFKNKKTDENLMHNHFQFNHYLGNKKSLFYHLTLYYNILNKPSSNAIPQTFHIKSLHNDTNYEEFLSEFNRLSKNKAIQNIWILKPGENSNRGSGIDVFNDIRRLKLLVKGEKYKDGQPKTYIIQKYIERPLLYQGRKFDIRHYMIVTMLYGQLRAYWYGQGYIRTSSYKFNLFQLEDSMIHLTNDAIQKQSKDYGSHQEGNKISYMDLQKYFDKNYPYRHFDFKKIYEKMRDLAKDSICSTYMSLFQSKKIHNFEIFGLDFMIDDHLKVHLIEINTNPCLQISSGLLGRIIPLMVEQTFRISLDAIFPPNMHYSNNSKSLAPDCSLQKLQLQLIFDQSLERQGLEQLYSRHQTEYKQMISILRGSENQDEQTFENEGEDVEIDSFLT